jgi:hypothetical protein
MKKSKMETAKSLAEGHFRVDPYLRHVHLIEPMDEQDPKDPIRLLEVVEGTLAMGIEPIGFPADSARGIEYPSMIVEISPDVYENVRTGIIRFADRDWTIGTELLAS